MVDEAARVAQQEAVAEKRAAAVAAPAAKRGVAEESVAAATAMRGWRRRLVIFCRHSYSGSCQVGAARSAGHSRLR